VLCLSWGVAVSVVATIQLTFALGLDSPYDRLAAVTFLLAPLYPIAYWMITAAAALRAELPALLRRPTERRVAWDIPRDQIPPA
jgi:hypothetical protein